MYRLEWIEQLKLRTAATTARNDVRAAVSPVIFKLGLTSLLTDISSEMVNSLLPVYIVLYLHLSPLQYGVISGVYNGAAIAVLSLIAGLLADRTRRHKEVAAAGYGISAICKLLLIAAGSAWGWITAVMAIDRVGKASRTAPRDALISFNSSRESLATSFAVHRAMDAGGALLGPVIAFALLTQLPGAFDAVWVTSFAFAVLGLASLLLFVQNPVGAAISLRSFSSHEMWRLLKAPQFRVIVGAGILLSVATIEDGFLYLLLQQRGNVSTGFFPLFYVGTMCCYMLLAIPVGRVADRWGRLPIFLSGYGAIGLIYFLLSSQTGPWIPWACLFFFGLYYAATEGVLMAMASAVVPGELRTSGLAVLGTMMGLGKMTASLIFGWLWQFHGVQASVAVFGAAFVPILIVVALWMYTTTYEQFAP